MPFNFKRRKNPLIKIGQNNGRFFADSESRLFTILKGDVVISIEDGSHSSIHRSDIHYFLIERRPGNSQSSLFVEYSQNGRTMKMEVGEVSEEMKREAAQWAKQVNQRYYHNT